MLRQQISNHFFTFDLFPILNQCKREGRAGKATYKANSDPNSTKPIGQCKTQMKYPQRQRYKHKSTMLKGLPS